MRAAILGVARFGLVAALALAAGCGSGGLGTKDAATDTPAPIKKYVALGDAFSAAPYVGTADPAGGCLRSSDNFPALVAARLEVALTDVSCTGATTDAVLHPSRSPDGKSKLPAQIDALTADTDLVTLSVGIQDSDLLHRAFAICMKIPCKPTQLPASTIGPEAAAAGQAITEVVRAIQAKAPTAYVVLVGYPKLIPDQNPCSLIPAMRTADYQGTTYLFAQLNAYVESAARQTGAWFADLAPATSGHHVCSTEPWVRTPGDPHGQAVVLMPLAPAQQAAADAVLAGVDAR